MQVTPRPTEEQQLTGGDFIRVRDVSKIYTTRDGPVRALSRVSLSARHDELIAILGPSGCGKSTLLMIVAGLAAASAGVVEVDGQPVRKPQTNVGVVFQQDVLLEWRTALGNIMLQAEARKMPRASAEQHARELLASVGLAGFENNYPHELSGGMRQRVSICRALIHEPPLLLMDEPFGALDALTRDQMSLDLERMWGARQTTVLFVTHSVAEAVFLADRVAVMTARPGRVDRVIDIDLPHPRTLRMRESPEFIEYVHTITGIFLDRGILYEGRS